MGVKEDAGSNMEDNREESEVVKSIRLMSQTMTNAISNLNNSIIELKKATIEKELTKDKINSNVKNKK